MVVLTLGNSGIIAPPLSSNIAAARHVVEADDSGDAILGTFIAAYIFYVATETTTAGWIAPHLHRVGYSASLGSVITAGFWLGLAVGRVLAGPAGSASLAIIDWSSPDSPRPSRSVCSRS